MEGSVGCALDHSTVLWGEMEKGWQIGGECSKGLDGYHHTIVLETESPLTRVESPRKRVLGEAGEHEEGLTPLRRSLAHHLGSGIKQRGLEGCV